MRIDVELDPELRELLVKILAPGESPELAALLGRLEGPERLLGFQGPKAVPLEPGEVLRFYGEDKEVRAQTVDGRAYTVRLRLYELEERLDATRFVRISNGEIVNLDRVTAVDLSLSGTICMTLDGSVRAYVSRRYMKKIKETLNLGRRNGYENK